MIANGAIPKARGRQARIIEPERPTHKGVHKGQGRPAVPPARKRIRRLGGHLVGPTFAVPRNHAASGNSASCVTKNATREAEICTSGLHPMDLRFARFLGSGERSPCLGARQSRRDERQAGQIGRARRFCRADLRPAGRRPPKARARRSARKRSGLPARRTGRHGFAGGHRGVARPNATATIVREKHHGNA